MGTLLNDASCYYVCSDNTGNCGGPGYQSVYQIFGIHNKLFLDLVKFCYNEQLNN